MTFSPFCPAGQNKYSVPLSDKRKEALFLTALGSKTGSKTTKQAVDSRVWIGGLEVGGFWMTGLADGQLQILTTASPLGFCCPHVSRETFCAVESNQEGRARGALACDVFHANHFALERATEKQA